ncbi:MAG: hypothetical protein E7192_08530 [Erysipelotrichaceae bacterium]|nr:hypothetical protein [Erysipelotrichaceae bacterium]
MSFMNKLKNKKQNAAKETLTKAAGNLTKQKRTIVFEDMPSTLEEFKALEEARMSTPFDTAALTVCALSYYPINKQLSIEMLNFLRGPRPLSGMDLQFIADRFRDKDYVPRSYFLGATPDNDYEPNEPYSIEVEDNPYSYQNEGYATLYIRSGGADSPRQVQLRKAKDEKWYLWDQFLLADIRKPESENPWA